MRRFREARVGFVAIRGLGAEQASSSISRNLFKQSATFLPWSRKRWLVTKNSPDLFILDLFFNRNLSRTSSGKLFDFAMSHRITTLVFNLFTFCPPGPGDREKRNSNSRKGMDRDSLTTNTFEVYFQLVHARCVLTFQPPSGTIHVARHNGII